MSEFSLSLLGPFKATLGKQPIDDFRTRKVQALLIFLAVEPEGHSRDMLLNLLWPGLPEKSARSNLRQILYYLRRDLPDVDGNGQGKEPVVIANRQEIRVNPQAAVAVDVWQFEALLDEVRAHDHLDLFLCGDCAERLEQAVFLYRGDLLVDFYLDDSNEFEEWAQARREYFRRKVLDALSNLTTMAVRARDFTTAETYAEKQLEIDNLRESAYRQLMEILALSGRREQALAVYDTCRQMLIEELGMEPAVRTTEYYEKILADDLHFERFDRQDVRGYELKELIMDGSYGTVYRAMQPTISRQVAVKLIHRKYADDPEFIRRFEAEAQMIAQLEHPYIVPLYDYWRGPEGAYLVMRYMDGGTLLDQLRGGAWDAERAAGMLDQIAGALTIAHQKEIVHRDIKPANILLDAAGNAYLADFGIAKQLTNERQLTAEGVVAGTLDYISPEQIIKEAVTPQSDIYSLGATLYETLTGERPFGDTSVAQLLYCHLHESIPLVTASRPDIPAEIDQVLQKATAKKPAERYATVAEMAAAFRRALNGSGAETDEWIKAAVPTLVEVYNPYKGLHAFQEADADDFFGRDALVQQLLARLSEPA
ncbi:MAG: protein kinase, partial [Candidatus Promineifilaceae bacterium]|nr:protein kinase [Candidatus Promineifilaceae bacterium]